MLKRGFFLLIVAALFSLIAIQPSAEACGGFFCQNVPVVQQTERIIFGVNAVDKLITAYVQINYVGAAPDFSWVVPVPSVPVIGVAEIETFDELDQLTAPVFNPPSRPACTPLPQGTPVMPQTGGGGGGVEVLASGEAGPYHYDVITSPDPNALITWLRENNYQITEQMEPLVKVYTDEGMIFLAMKLQPERGVDEIQPVVMTYQSEKPMIPLRLTAVAAVPNMNVITWIFADQQAYTTNYARPEIADNNIRFFAFSGHNYLSLVDQTVDLYQGRAFVTEYAQTTRQFFRDYDPVDPLLNNLLKRYPYVTRFFGRISPEEMTVDPMFDFSADLPDVSNVHDLTSFDPEVVWGCTNVPVNIQYNTEFVPAGFK